MLQGFFAALVQSANTSFKTLLESLFSTARSAVAPGGPVSKQAFYSIAQCVAVLCLAAGDAECSSTVAMLVTTLRTSNGTDVVNSSSGMAVNMEICGTQAFFLIAVVFLNICVMILLLSDPHQVKSSNIN